MKLRALRGNVLVTEFEQGIRNVGSIIIPDDNGTSGGIRPRWAKVYAVGEDITTVKPGEWVLIKHGDWTRAMTIKDDSGDSITLHGIRWPEGAMLVSDDPAGISTFSECGIEGSHRKDRETHRIIK